MVIHSASDPRPRTTLCGDYFYNYFTRGLDILFDGQVCFLVNLFVCHMLSCNFFVTNLSGYQNFRHIKSKSLFYTQIVLGTLISIHILNAILSSTHLIVSTFCELFVFVNEYATIFIWPKLFCVVTGSFPENKTSKNCITASTKWEQVKVIFVFKLVIVNFFLRLLI